MTTSSSELYRRVFGCLVGMAAGDALGQSCRDLDWRKIRERYGSQMEFQPWVSGTENSNPHPKGQVGDLARLSVLFADRAVMNKTMPRISLLIDELFAQHSLNSLPAQAALARIRAGIEPSRSAVPELAGPEALYLAVPVAICHIGDPEAAFTSVRSIAGPILLGPSLEAGQVFAAALAVALMPGATPVQVFEAAIDLAPPSCSKNIRPAYLFAREHLGHPAHLVTPNIHDRFSSRSATDPHGPTLESLAVSLVYLLLCDGLPEQTIQACVSYGGWSHATAAAGGALAGAMSTSDKVPLAWCKTVLSANPLLDIPKTAEGLCQIVLSDGERQKDRLTQILKMAGEE